MKVVLTVTVALDIEGIAPERLPVSAPIEEKVPPLEAFQAQVDRHGLTIKSVDADAATVLIESYDEWHARTFQGTFGTVH